MRQSGEVLGQRYRVACMLGSGGMGAVYLAHDGSIGDRQVAVKELQVDSLDANLLARAAEQFHAEAVLLGRLQHPGVVSVIDFFSSEGHHYLVMEHVEGTSLDRLVDSGARPALAQIVDWIHQICDALVYLHGQTPPVIVRDLKPGNVMLGSDGRIRLIDFGLARTFDTRTGSFIKGMGSPGYAPLEQYGAGDTSPQTDIYSLGATLYSLLTGKMPPTAVDLAAGNAELEPPSAARTDCPTAVDAVVRKMMALRCPDRYGSVQDARTALQAAFEGKPAKRDLTLQRPAAGKTSTAASVYAQACRDVQRPTRGGQGVPTMPALGVPAPHSGNELSNPLHLASPVSPLEPFPQRFAGLPPAPEDIIAVPSGTLSKKLTVDVPLTCAAFSGDGQRIAVGAKDGTIHLWDISARQAGTRIEGCKGVVRGVAFLRGDAALAVASEDGLLVFDLSAGRLEARLDNVGAVCVALSLDRGTLAWGCSDNHVAVLDVASFSGRRIRFRVPDRPGAIALTVDGRVVGVARRDRILSLHNVATGKPICSLRGNGPRPSGVAFSPTGPQLAACWDETKMDVWTLRDDPGFTRIGTHAGTLESAAFSPDGALLAAAGRGKSIDLWSAANLAHHASLQGHRDAISAIAFSPDGRKLASASWDGACRLWDVVL